LFTTLAAQGSGLAISLLERVFVTAVLLRVWGVNQFSDWSLLLAAVGMLLLADLGMLFYFGNRFQLAALEGDDKSFQRFVELSIYCYAVCSLILFAVMLGIAFISMPGELLSLTALDRQTAFFGFLILSLYQLSMFGRSSVSQIYRANNNYGIGIFIGLVPKALSALLLIGLGLAGGGVVLLAAAYLLIDLIAGWGLMLWDLTRRYPKVRFRASRPTFVELRDIFLHVKWLALSSSAPGAWLNIPVLLIGYFELSGLPLVSFVVSRTVVNLGRQTAQLAAVAIGIELADESLRGWPDDLTRRLQLLGSALMAMSSAAMVGLYIFGPMILGVWTGKAELFDGPTFAALALPAVLIAPISLLTYLMILSNIPKPPAIAYAAQVAIGLVAAALLTPLYGVTGLAIGLAAGEIVAQYVILSFVARSTIPLAIIPYALSALKFGFLASVWSGLVATIAVHFASPGLSSFLISGAVWTVVGFGPVLISIVPQKERNALRNWLLNSTTAFWP